MSIVNKRIKQLERDLESIETRIKLIENEVKLQSKKLDVCAQNQLVMEKRWEETPPLEYYNK